MLDEAAQFDHLSGWGQKLSGDESTFLEAIQDLSAVSKGRLKAARQAVGNGYAISYEFVSTGKAGSTDAQPAGFRYVSGKRLASLFEDYLGGVRPIPALSMSIASEYAEFPNEREVSLGIFLVSGREVHRLVNQYPSRLFARNIRGFLGDANQVNKKITETVSDRPKEFVFLNNGLTIVCDRSVVTAEHGKRTLTLDNPQVVNGQQTSKSLAGVTAEAADTVQVTVRVVTIGRAAVDSIEYDRLVRAIVEATNRQSSIPVTELRSNDRVQVELQRRLRKLGYYYARKTGNYGDYLLKAAGNPLIIRREMADAVSGCLWESLPHRETKATLYDDKYYDQIFDADHAERNLAAWHLWRDVQAQIKKSRRGAAREQGKWLALYVIWNLLSGSEEFSRRKYLDLKRGPAKGAFKKATTDLIKEVAESIDDFYTATTGGRIEPVPFFKTPNLAPQYDAYLNGAGNAYRPSIEGRIAQLIASMKL